MLDIEVDRVREDSLRDFIEAQQHEAEDEILNALQHNELQGTREQLGKIEAYGEILPYLDTRVNRGRGSLDVLRE